MGRKIKILYGILLLFGLFSLLRTIILVWSCNLLDFSIFYYTGQALLSHQNPYLDPRLFTQASYPPITFLFMIPISMLPFSIAAKFWIFISICSYLASIFILYKIIKISYVKIIIIFTATVISFPFKFTIGMGQINLILLLCLTLSIYYFFRKKNLSTFLMSAVILIKLFPVGLLIGYMQKKEYLYVIKTLIITIIIIIASLIFIKPYLYIYYLNKIFIPMVSVPGGDVYYNQSITELFARLNISGEYLTFFRIIIFIITLYHIFKNKFNLYNSLSIILTMIILINSFSWQHHLVLLIIPFYFLLSIKFTLKEYLFLATAYLLIAVNIKNPAVNNNIFSPFILSHGFIGTLMLWGFQLIHKSKISIK